MGTWKWVVENWFNLISAGGIIGGLFFTGASLRSETQTRRTANLIALTQSHRDLWRDLYDQEELARVLDPGANIASSPVTRAEELFVISVIQHLNAVYRATRNDL